ncbi:MAG: bis(5'-nucleosyl)-tetraphosphatase (symmetrical) YqeK [Eubacteriaceae bacterium]
MNNDSIKKDLKTDLTSKRYLHTINVVKTAKKLAARYHSDHDKVVKAALLHDCAKNFSCDELIFYADKSHLKIDKITLLEPQLLHGPVGAYIAEKKYGILDKEVLNAICYHTTGRAKMSKIEKIIYLADFIEEGRSYPGVEKLRGIAFENLNDAVLLALSNTIRYITSIDGLIHPRTIIARNDLIIKTRKRK